MESALLERQQVRVVVVAARAFGEDVDGLAVFVHLLCGLVESCDGLGAGFALDEDGFAESHCIDLLVTKFPDMCRPQELYRSKLTEPAQNRHVHQTLLRRHTGILREQVAKEQHIQLRLVVSKQHRRPQLLPLFAMQAAFRILYLKPHAGEQQHGPFEGACRSPLAEPSIAHNVQTCGREGAVGCADEKGGEGGRAAGVEVYGLDLGGAGNEVGGLGGEEDGDRGADEDVGEDGGEGHAGGAV